PCASSRNDASAAPAYALLTPEPLSGRSRISVLALVQDIAAPVLRPGILARALGARLFFAQAHRLDLVLARPKQQKHTLDPVRAPLPEADVVLAAAALVRVALDEHLALRMLAQVFGVRLDQRLVLVLHLVLVQVIEDRALRKDAGLEGRVDT